MAQEETTLTGEYQGKNLYVQNPLSPDKVNFCTQEVYLNEKLVVSHPKTSAFEIDLSALKVGDPVFVKITYNPGCEPKVINPQVVRSKSKFHFITVNADAISLNWNTVGELPHGKYEVEHYVYKQWEKDTTLEGKGSFDNNQYAVTPTYHSGDNKYRILYVQNDGHTFYSKVIDFFNDEPPVSFHPAQVNDKIYLSRPVPYQIVDSYGNKIARGKGKEISVINLKPGLYFLHIDNREEKFVKK